MNVYVQYMGSWQINIGLQKNIKQYNDMRKNVSSFLEVQIAWERFNFNVRDY